MPYFDTHKFIPLLGFLFVAFIFPLLVPVIREIKQNVHQDNKHTETVLSKTVKNMESAFTFL